MHSVFAVCMVFSMGDSNQTFPPLDEDTLNFTLLENRGFRLTYALSLSLLMLFGLTTNLFIVVYTVVHPKTLKNPSLVLLCGLSLSHLTSCCFYIPFPLITSAYGEWIFGSTELQCAVLCKINSFFLVFPLITSIAILGLISVDRCLYIARPIHYNHHINSKITFVVLGITALLSFIYASLPFTGTGKVIFYPGIFSCVPSWSGLMQRSISLVVICFLIVLIIVPTVVTFFVTKKFIAKDYMRKSSLTLDEKVVDHRRDLYKRRMCNLLGIFGMFLALYSTAFVPYVTIMIVRGVTDELPETFVAVDFLVIMSINVTSPIVQSYFRKDLKNALKNVFCFQTLLNHRHGNKIESRSNVVTTRSVNEDVG